MVREDLNSCKGAAQAPVALAPLPAAVPSFASVTDTKGALVNNFAADLELRNRENALSSSISFQAPAPGERARAA